MHGVFHKLFAYRRPLPVQIVGRDSSTIEKREKNSDEIEFLIQLKIAPHILLPRNIRWLVGIDLFRKAYLSYFYGWQIEP